MFSPNAPLNRRRSGLALVLAVLLVLVGFPVGSAGDDPPADRADGERRPVVLLLPFKNLVAIYGGAGNIRSPINGRIFLSGPVEDKAVAYLDIKLHDRLQAREIYTLVAAARADDVLAALANRNPPPGSERELWVEVGRALGADAVLGGFIYRFRDRTGKDYGVDEVASVAFDLHLVRVRDGRIQWSGRIDETQQPLSSNILNIKKFINRGGKWVTSRQMALEGLEALIAEMPR